MMQERSEVACGFGYLLGISDHIILVPALLYSNFAVSGLPLQFVKESIFQ